MTVEVIKISKINPFKLTIDGLLNLEGEPHQHLKRDRKGIVNSKKRVRDNAEVLTQPREVFDMIQLVEDSAGEDMPLFSRTYLEPACGDGNFLTEIIKRKLFHAYDVADGDLEKWNRLALVSFSSLYGLDILDDNIENSKKRLADVFLLMGALFNNLSKDQVHQLRKIYFDTKLNYQDFINAFPDDVSFNYRKNVFNVLSYDWKDFSDLPLDDTRDLSACAVASDGFLYTIKSLLNSNIKKKSFLQPCEKKGYIAKCPDDLYFISYEWCEEWLDTGNGNAVPKLRKYWVERNEYEPLEDKGGVSYEVAH